MKKVLFFSYASGYFRQYILHFYFGSFFSNFFRFKIQVINWNNHDITKWFAFINQQIHFCVYLRNHSKLKDQTDQLINLWTKKYAVNSVFLDYSLSLSRREILGIHIAVKLFFCLYLHLEQISWSLASSTYYYEFTVFR